MKITVLIGGFLIASGVSLLRAGSVLSLGNGIEAHGTLTLSATTIHVEGSQATDVNLSDVLEADFGEAPFQLDCFFSSSIVGNQLPAGWKAQDIGPVESPGSVACADGALTLSGSGITHNPKVPIVSDNLFFVGQQWTGDGQWTARVKEIDAQSPTTLAGLMLRDTLDADSAVSCMGVMVPPNGSNSTNGVIGVRVEAGKPLHGLALSRDFPIWLRLTRYGATVFASTSSDGKEWDLIAENNLKSFASPWIGLFTDSRVNKTLGKAVIDHVSFTPTPPSVQVLPPGVLLQGGSFLAGAFEHLSFDPANPTDGSFLRNGKPVAIARSKTAVVIMLPMARSQIVAMGSHLGLLMKNGDVMDGDFDSISKSTVVISSVLLGTSTYNQAEVSACFLQPLQALPATYEIRLRDGSIVNATDLSSNGGEVVIQDVSGVTVEVSMDEIAQIRAGTAQVQSLAELNWKATPAAPAANAPGLIANWPSTNAAPIVNAVPDQLPLVPCWEGKNQEQIMEVPIGTTVEFPLPGKFRALGVRVTLSPDSPPNSNATIRVLADGKEIARTPPFKAGDQPRFMEVTLQHPKTVTLEADSIFAGPKVFFIDPVALRDK